MAKKRSIKRIFLFGHHGRKNTGDDAMLYSLLLILHRMCPRATFCVASSIPLVLPSEVRHQVVILPRNVIPIMREVIRCQSVLLGGGTLFLDHGGRLFFLRVLVRFLAIVLWCKLWRRPVYLVGVGVGPLSTWWGIFLGKLICRMADFISVRDRASFATLRGMGVSADRITVAFELAVLLRAPIYIPPAKKQFVLGVSFLPYFTIYHKDLDKDRQMVEQIAKGLNHWLLEEPQGRIHLIIFRDQPWAGDMEIAKKLLELLPSGRVQLISYSPNPHQMLRNVAECTSFVSMRLHSAVFCYLGKVPMVIINYHPKCCAFANEIMLPDHAVISMEELMAGRLGHYLIRLLHNPDAFASQLPLEEALLRAQAILPPQLGESNACNARRTG